DYSCQVWDSESDYYIF
nr:immunoglobulin light chain junction region [Macaca mulatta]MOV67842.1 immunoglobulin light chain junction region [Macaca mulatta]MOV69068.1 immunoglobulin light chain junction region [Macaca mulatta]MOV69526.1 immunoglobulin light chain junction region [Macaca mulatta]MOV69723.1 immunoglobulin light chain junction region [Macaca mulatta]